MIERAVVTPEIPVAEANGKTVIPASGKRKPTRRKKDGPRPRKDAVPAKKASRVSMPFPRATLQDALPLANAIQEHAPGGTIRRMTLFEKLKKSPESGPSRMMITNSSKYGITEGGYQAENLNLTPVGAQATNPDTSEADRFNALFKLGFENVDVFKHLYERNADKRLASPEVLEDQIAEYPIPKEQRRECVDLFVENAKFLKLLRLIGGAQRLVTVAHVTDELRSSGPVPPAAALATHVGPSSGQSTGTKLICFVVAPIGDEGDEKRKHSDMILGSFIEPALEKEGLEIIRADKLERPGMISGQMIDLLINAAVVIVDLSYHNPNVFYELGIRHVLRKPTVHITRKRDPIPFDIKDFRTVVIDTSDMYELVGNLESYRAEIANHVRMALQGTGATENPVSVCAPQLRVTFGDAPSVAPGAT